MEQSSDTTLTELRQKEIFLALLNRLKGTGMDDATSRADLAERCGVSLDALKVIERRGMARDWPPLD